MDRYISRYDFGSTTIKHKGKEVVTSINTGFFDNFKEVVENDSFALGTVKQYIQHRPDTISDIFYDNSTYWWYLLLYNNISDPFNELNASDPFLIPTLNDFLQR